MSETTSTPPPTSEDRQEAFHRKQIDSLIVKVRAILLERSDSQLATLLKSSYEEVMTTFEAGALPTNIAFNVIQDFLVKLTTL